MEILSRHPLLVSRVRIPHKLDLRRFALSSPALHFRFSFSYSALAFIKRDSSPPFCPLPSPQMLSPIFTHRRPYSPDIAFPASDASMKDSVFDDAAHYVSPDADQMIFGIDLEDTPSLHPPSAPYQWDPYEIDSDMKPAYSFSSLSAVSHYDYATS